VQNYQWDPDGDGVFDATTTVNSLAHTYAGAGIFYPRVRITMVDGRQADDVKQVTVTSTVTLALNTDTLDAQLAQSVTITTTLSAATTASLIVETRGGTPVRTLFPLTERAAGTYNDSWDGKNDAGQYVDEGIYKVVLVYELNGELRRLDLSTTTGGQEYNPPRTSIPSTFEPYNNRPLTIDFTLTRASEVTAFMGSFNVNTRYVTFYTRQAFGRGTYRITWNGDNAEGQIIKPAPGDAFLFGIFGYTLPNNGVFVRNGVQLSAMSSFPPIFDPTGLTPAGQPIRCAVTFNLSLPATAELVVQDAITGIVVARVQYPNLPAGANTVQWDGRAGDGRYAAPGTYRLGVTAIQANGFRSLSSFVLQRVFY
jgi:flagellar hook assembly protein FlgD